MINNRIFQSYWLAGYEGADHVNNAGLPLSMSDSMQHTNLPYDDYLLLGNFEIGTVRESVDWQVVEKDGHVGFSSIEARACRAGASITCVFPDHFPTQPHLTTKEPQ